MPSAGDHCPRGNFSPESWLCAHLRSEFYTAYCSVWFFYEDFVTLDILNGLEPLEAILSDLGLVA